MCLPADTRRISLARCFQHLPKRKLVSSFIDAYNSVLAATEADLFGMFNVFSKTFQPFLNLRPTCAHFVPIDAELARDLGLRESFFHVADAGG